MDKHMVSTFLVLIVAVVQAHTQQTTSSSGDSSTVDALISHTTVNVGDLAMGSESSSSSRKANFIKELIALLTPSSLSNFESTTESAPIDVLSRSSLPDQKPALFDNASPSTEEFVDDLDDTTLSTGSSSSDERGDVGDVDFVAYTRSNSESASTAITTQVVYIFSRADDDASQSASSFSAGTVQPNNEKIAFKNAALEFSTVESTNPNEVPDTASSSPSTSTTPTFGKKATSTIGSSNQDQDENNTVLTTSDSAVSSPIFYACVVLGAVGLVGAVVASRAKDNRDVSDKCLVTTEAPAITPPLAVAHPSVWAPPASEVHVVIDDHRFALL